MRVLAFVRAMRWKGLIVTAVVTAILGLVLTLYSCGKPDRNTTTETQSANITTLQAAEPAEKDASCTPATCVVE